MDDAGAARSLVRSKAGRYGRRRLERELSARGFGADVISAALSDLDSEGEESALARAFERLWRQTRGLDREKRRSRVWNALVRRGFRATAISDIMKNSDEVD